MAVQIVKVERNLGRHDVAGGDHKSVAVGRTQQVAEPANFVFDPRGGPRNEPILIVHGPEESDFPAELVQAIGLYQVTGILKSDQKSRKVYTSQLARDVSAAKLSVIIVPILGTLREITLVCGARANRVRLLANEK